MKKCIICEKIKNEEEFNKEHIIPEFIGGSLTINSVCKSCNSRLGKEIDSEILNDYLIKCHVVKKKKKKKKNSSAAVFYGTGGRALFFSLFPFTLRQDPL